MNVLGFSSDSRCYVVILLQNLDYSSASRLAVDLATGLDPARFAVQLVILGGPAHLAPLAETQGVELHWLGKSTRPGPGRLPGLVSLLRRMRPQLLFCLGVLPNVLGRLAGRLAGVAHVVGSLRRPGDGWRQLEPLWGLLAERVTLPAQSLRHSLPPWVKGRGVQLFEGVDREVFAPAKVKLREDAPRILCLARLDRHGGQELLLRAFSLLPAMEPRPRLLLAGDGPRRDKLSSLIRHMELDGAVELLPARQDVAHLYHVARFAVLPGLRMGAPAVALEAMACGLPVVAAKVGGLEEIVAHEQTGLLVAPGGAAPLARAMEQLLQNEALCRRMGEAGRLRALELGNRRQCLQAYGEFFHNLVAGI